MSTMRSKHSWLGLAAAAGLAAATGTALADAPTVTVSTDPAGPIIFLDNPGVDPVKVLSALGHTTLQNLVQFNVLVDDGSGFVSIIGGNKNPYTVGNACHNDILTLPNYVDCTTNGSNAGVITVNWTPDVGVYVVRASARHSPNTTSDDEDVEIAQTVIDVQYPAPPAVANAYIKSNYGRITGGCRGYIISNIAQNHGQDEKYGPKGGPYDDALIQSDVVYYKSQC